MKIAIFPDEIHRKIKLNTVDSVDNVDNFLECKLCETGDVEFKRLLRILVEKCCQIM